MMGVNKMYEEMLLRPVVLEVGESFPLEFLAPLRGLWGDSGVQKVVAQGNVVALPEKYLPLPLPLTRIRTNEIKV